MMPEIDKSITLLHKEADYNEYILEHVSNVKKIFLNLCSVPECRDYMIKLLSHECRSIDDLSYNIKIHDQSKFGNEEFTPYRKKFFPIDDQEKEENGPDFEMAWRHHKQVNPHHWDHWNDKCIPDAMPSIYVLEMFCDHAAMSLKFGGTALEWFEDNKNKIVLGAKQLEYYKHIGEMYYKYYNAKGERRK